MARRLPEREASKAREGAEIPLEQVRVELDRLRQGLDTVGNALGRAEEQRRAQHEHEALLASEIHHRVRNLLAVVRSVFSRTMETAGSMEEAADHFRGRLDAIARSHIGSIGGLARAVDLENMVRDELLVFQLDRDPRIKIGGSAVGLAPRTAELMGLALHELATNSVKFGVLGDAGARGRLLVHWKKAGDTLLFEWVESGMRAVDIAPAHRGFGREYIEEALPYQLGASTVFELAAGGLKCVIRLPLAERT